MDTPTQPPSNQPPQQPEIPAKLLSFVDELIDKRFTGQNLDEGVRAEIKKDILGQLDEYILNATLDEFTDEEVDEFEKLVTENKPLDVVRQFAMDRIPEYNDFMANVLLDFEEDYLGDKKQEPQK